MKSIGQILKHHGVVANYALLGDLREKIENQISANEFKALKHDRSTLAADKLRLSKELRNMRQEDEALRAVADAAAKLAPIIAEHSQAYLNGNNSALLDVTLKRVACEKEISAAIAALEAVRKNGGAK